MRFSVTCLAVVAVALGGCRCQHSPLSPVDQPRLTAAPARLTFPATWVGQATSATVSLSNSGGAPAVGVVTLDAPFTASAAAIDVPGGAAVGLTVRFAPGEARRFEGVLRVGGLEIPVDGEGLAVPGCSGGEVCLESRFDFALGQCVLRAKADGVPCQTRCVPAGGACLGGLCRGRFDACDDGDACTADSCGEATGCLHVPIECPAATGACQVARCDAATGCGQQAIPDGTACGPQVCFAPESQVCLAGQCVSRPQPEGRCVSVNTWEPQYVPGRKRTALAYDSARQVLVLFGGDSSGSDQYRDTWELGPAGAWVQQKPAVSPPSRGGHSMVYDPAHQRVVLFGGLRLPSPISSRVWLADTWAWDGARWLALAPGLAPPARSGHAMVYDSARQRVVLFGGLGAGGALGDTWEWDGTSWTRSLPATAPAARSNHALAYDEVRQRVLLVGGTDASGGALSDTWEWDGTTWTQAAPALAPPPFDYGVAMTFAAARQRVVLYGHRFSQGVLYSETWEWDGAGWTLAAPAVAPLPRGWVALTYDASRQRAVLFGGVRVNDVFADTWEWDGATWTPRAVVTAPPPRDVPAMAYDSSRSRVVLFAGSGLAAGQQYGAYDDTWEWDGASWLQRFPATSPSRRSSSAMAYDSRRQRVVLFGGWNHPGYLNDTWEWDGTTWLQRFPLTVPPPRAFHSMAYDAARGRIVLFGGWGSPADPDTWEWDGTTWTRHSVVPSPSTRSRLGLSYDVVRQRVVLFGGDSNGDETWEWDGASWLLRAASPSPASRSGHAQAYDAIRQRTIVTGGCYLGMDLWAWDGLRWVRQAPAAFPLFDHAVSAFDEARQRLVLFSGGSGDTWVYVP